MGKWEYSLADFSSQDRHLDVSLKNEIVSTSELQVERWDKVWQRKRDEERIGKWESEGHRQLSLKIHNVKLDINEFLDEMIHRNLILKI